MNTTLLFAALRTLKSTMGGCVGIPYCTDTRQKGAQTLYLRHKLLAQRMCLRSLRGVFSTGALAARAVDWLTLLKRCSTTLIYTRSPFASRCDEIKISINQGRHASYVTSALTFIRRAQGNQENIIITVTVIIITGPHEAGVHQLPLLVVAMEQLLRQRLLYHRRIHLLRERR